MARVSKNMFLRGLKGSLGDQFVIRKGRGGTTVVSDKPSFGEDRQYSDSQLAHQIAFKQAVAYANSVKEEQLYVAKAMDTDKSPFNMAVADWFRHPQVLGFDVREWDGTPGSLIHVDAIDDTKVTKVEVSIYDPEGVLLEEGEAQPAEGTWWTYTAHTTVPLEPMPQVIATAYDRPGHLTRKVWEE